jgi:RHS repeat-associated protein
LRVEWTATVQYGYADGAANTIRRTSMTYPNGRVLSYLYGSSPHDGPLGRVGGLSLPGMEENVVDYQYFGLGSFASLTYADVPVFWGVAGGASYPGLDNFGRVVDLSWHTNLGETTTALVHLKYGYDRASNRTFRRDEVASSLSKSFDEFYTYDGMHRLQTASRGTLDTGAAPPNTRLTTSTFNQGWQLDPTGNWSRFTQTAPGATGTIDQLSQTRTQNAANEITAIGATAGPVWYQPAHDRAGNMTAMPKPSTPTAGYAAIYDAWNRLVQLNDGETIVAQYRYDGLNRRTTKTIGGTSRHYYYSDQWQVLEEQVGASTAAERQFVWGVRYIDDLVLRDRDTDDDGDLDERLYALQDVLFSVVATFQSTGTPGIQERYIYDPYGQSTVLDSTFGNSPPGKDWEVRFTGQRLDLTAGLHLCRRRWYHALVGTFVNRDPIAYRGGSVNVYNYVHNRPTSLLDAFGVAAHPVLRRISTAKKKEWEIKDKNGNKCGVVRISVPERKGAGGKPVEGGVFLEFDDTRKSPKCDSCKNGEFGWIQHRIVLERPEGGGKDPGDFYFDEDPWYDNDSAGGKRGSKSNPAATPQPAESQRPARGAWRENPWYGGLAKPDAATPDPKNPKPQTSLFDAPGDISIDGEEYIAQLVCRSEGTVYFSYVYYSEDEIFYGASATERLIKKWDENTKKIRPEK